MENEFFERYLNFLMKLKEMVEDEIYFIRTHKLAARKAKFPIGAMVRFKSWDTLVGEYGLDKNGEINCCEGFVPEMKKFCGLKVVITDVALRSNGETVEYFITLAPGSIISQSKRDYFNEEFNEWTFTEDMFEYYDGM